MTLTDEDLKKMEILDKVFQYLSLTEIETLTQADLVVGKLRTNTTSMTGPIMGMYSHVRSAESDLMLLKNDHQMLKNDFGMLLKSMKYQYMNSGTFTDFTSLCSRYGVY